MASLAVNAWLSNRWIAIYRRARKRAQARGTEVEAELNVELSRWEASYPEAPPFLDPAEA